MRPEPAFLRDILCLRNQDSGANTKADAGEKGMKNAGLIPQSGTQYAKKNSLVSFAFFAPWREILRAVRFFHGF